MTPGTSEHRRSALPAYSDPTYYEWDVVDTNPLGENPCPSSHLHHSASAAGMFMLAPSEHFLDKDVFSHRGKMFLFQPHHRTVLKNLWKEPPWKKAQNKPKPWRKMYEQHRFSSSFTFSLLCWSLFVLQNHINSSGRKFGKHYSNMLPPDKNAKNATKSKDSAVNSQKKPV